MSPAATANLAIAQAPEPPPPSDAVAALGTPPAPHASTCNSPALDGGSKPPLPMLTRPEPGVLMVLNATSAEKGANPAPPINGGIQLPATSIGWVTSTYISRFVASGTPQPQTSWVSSVVGGAV